MKKGKDIPVIIGTRGSELALWQAHFTQSELKKHGIASELRIIKTKGDATQEWNLSFTKMEGKGFFTKELEDALLDGSIDLAVHSCKDLPTVSPAELQIAAYSKRANPFDVLLIRKDKADHTQTLKLPVNAVVGTSSARRKSQLLAFRPDLEVKDLRGNVPTRVQKLRDGQYDAILLAVAGLDRLKISLDEFIALELKAPMFVPAPAQGVLAFQIRKGDDDMKSVCTFLNDEDSAALTKIERDLLHDFEGGCQVPLGVYAETKDDVIHAWISQSESWNTLPKRTHVRLNSAADFDPGSIVQQFKEKKAASVFISSALDENDYLVRSLRAHQYTVAYESLLEFTAVDFEFDGNADWIFFSSKNAIRFFYDKVGTENSLPALAAVGESTAQELRSRGMKVDFTGDGSGASTAKVFEEIASGIVLFPMAEHSLREVQQHIFNPTIQIKDLVVYHNTPKKLIPKRTENVLVFTSPMNAESYFEQHLPDPGQTVIANGLSTSKKLGSLNIQHRTAYSPYAWSILDEIFSF